MSVVLLPPNLAALAKLVADSGARYSINGIQITYSQSEEGQKYTATATDGKYLGRVTGTPDAAAEYPSLKGLEQTNGCMQAILPAQDFAQALKSVPKKTAKPILRNLACNLGEKVTTLASTNYEADKVSEVRNLEGRFPEVQDVLPPREPFFTMRVDPARLRTLCEVAATFCGEVELRFYGHDRVMSLVGTNDSGQEFLGLLMPCVSQDESSLALDVRDQHLDRAAKASIKAVERIKKRN